MIEKTKLLLIKEKNLFLVSSVTPQTTKLEKVHSWNLIIFLLAQPQICVDFI